LVETQLDRIENMLKLIIQTTAVELSDPEKKQDLNIRIRNYKYDPTGATI